MTLSTPRTLRRGKAGSNWAAIAWRVRRAKTPPEVNLAAAYNSAMEEIERSHGSQLREMCMRDSVLRTPEADARDASAIASLSAGEGSARAKQYRSNTQPALSRWGSFLARHAGTFIGLVTCAFLPILYASYEDVLQGSMLVWVSLVIIAAGSQTARNSLQRTLTTKIGVLPATASRFIFGLPFAAITYMALMSVAGPGALPHASAMFYLWALVGSLGQLTATALMLKVMQDRSFVSVIAFVKTEPIFVLTFGFLFLGDKASLLAVAAIAVATTGVVLLSVKSGTGAKARTASIALAAAAVFGVTTVAFRGAVLSSGISQVTSAAAFTLFSTTLIQTLLTAGFFRLRNPKALSAMWHDSRQSLTAGVTSIVASQCLFMAYTFASAASVRTVSLTEVVFSQLVAMAYLKQSMSAREVASIAILVAGVAMLLVSVGR